jgi:DNA-binding winged helix-turn-helix (wHTH) protein
MAAVQYWSFGAFRLDASTACLWRDEQLLPLTPKPLAVLAYLVARAGQVVTKDELLEAVWPETVVSEGVLKTCLAQIRRVLGETAQAPQYIATVHRRGYRFMTPVTVQELPAPTSETAEPCMAAPTMLTPPARDWQDQPRRCFCSADSDERDRVAWPWAVHRAVWCR